MIIFCHILFIMVILVPHYTTTWPKSQQDCCKSEENWYSPSSPVGISCESVLSYEQWIYSYEHMNAILYAFIMRLTVSKCIFILENYETTKSYLHTKASFHKEFGRETPVKSNQDYFRTYTIETSRNWNGSYKITTQIFEENNFTNGYFN